MKGIFRIYYPAFLVFLAVFLFSVFSFYEIKKITAARRSKLFEMRINQATESLHKRITDYVQVLKGCQSFFYASDSVTSSDWKTYTENLNLQNNYPGIQGIAFASYIKKEDVPKVERKIRRDFPFFRIRSDFRNDYLTPITLIEPKDQRNLRAFGFDMFSEENRRNAMKKALLSGNPSISRKVTLVQETHTAVQPGFLLYLPIYKKPRKLKTTEDRVRNIQGFVYNPFRAYDLMNAVFDDYADIAIEVYDRFGGNSSNLLYHSDDGEINKQPELQSTRNLYVAGAKWVLQFSSTEHFGSAVERQQPAIVLVFGLATACMLALITVGVINRRQQAIEELKLIKKLERKKDEFIAIASHELKTPLTSVKAYLQMLERAELRETEKSFVTKANSQIKKLSNLIADLLDVSKIQAGRLVLNPSEFPLRELLEESIANIRLMYSSHEIVSCGPIPELLMHGDKFRLEQALLNILTNAIKYSPGTKHIYVEAKKGPQQNILIEIKDEGIGISAENQQKIFEKFFRPDELSPIFSGLGMGLYISNEIIKMHKGQISVVSEPGKGSTFRIDLPYDPSRA